jgi:hypothetical protein
MAGSLDPSTSEVDRRPVESSCSAAGGRRSSELHRRSGPRSGQSSSAEHRRLHRARCAGASGDAFVDSLDLSELGFERTVAAATGRPGFRPGDMLRLYIWGYLNQVRSSRMLERACARDLEALWLMRRLAPDYRTIAAFRHDPDISQSLARRPV